jgi:hypothetical protein
MKLLIDFPDSPDRAVVPYPKIFENAVGYFHFVIQPENGKLVMSYMVGRDSTANLDALDTQILLNVMENLEVLARNTVKTFNELAIAEIKR